ncbi:sensor histidine kinase [Brevibacterium sp. JSBI002]|uniref:sensor histidine kinase n=1 Tax=Brevibacterium sp. JSBI002 TaxID=2886045 RepID=UPI0022314828|nr:histidine kinase [Brevibacterium sp. JSBI002]UZD61974.1 histidine kinase [Brevibacterium sp. JSBI002]
MSEKTPENPQDQEPLGPGPEETQTREADPAANEREESISAADIVNAPATTEVDAAAVDEPTAREAGEFRAKPVDLDVPFATGSTRVMGAGAQAQRPDYPPMNPTRPVTYTHPTAPAQAGPRTRPSAGAPPVGYAPSNNPNYPTPPGRDPRPAPQPGPRPAPQPGPQFGRPSPNAQHAPHPQPMPTAQPMPRPRPPRRMKPPREPVAYAPVTGSLPLSRDEVTEIPADGPITWPKRPTGIIGVANLVLSAVLALIWAWIPLGLLFTGIGGIFALGLGVLALLVWVLVQQGANNAERYRAELIYSDKIPVPKIESSNREPGISRFLHNRWLQVKSGAFWRSTAHHYIKMLLGLIVVAGTIAAICGSIFGIFAAINPHGVNTFFIGESIDGPARIGVAIGAVIVLASSLAILWFAPLLDRALDRALLAPARTVALQAEVTELDRARMAGLEAAAAERLRIERDLHDGAQPRLVALTMTLGMAKSKIDSDPEKAKELVAEAHTEAKGIVNELRQLARGIHPAVLTDRGLDAAVSALAGRSTIPVDVDVRLEGRIGREAEAVSYFVVAECLTNISKHSGATRASVFIAPTETGVQIVVTDNGHGGARVDRSGRHTGIAGLIDRVEAARGTLNLTSPAGGPTTVVVEVPCAS